LPPRAYCGNVPGTVTHSKGFLAMRPPKVPSLSFILLLPAMAFAQDACRNGLSDVFTVESYEVTEEESSFSTNGYMRLDMVLLNSGERGVRMIDGSIVFQDVLGRDILRIGIDPDIRVEAGETTQQDGIYSNLRLLDVEREDVVVTTCIRGLVYSDGEVFRAGN